ESADGLEGGATKDDRTGEKPSTGVPGKAEVARKRAVAELFADRILAFLFADEDARVHCA
ncbi:MAG TPA: hypothetical protein VK287_04725, partial [Gaiellaceae bacterium]|nr:hypothetical protein [Gaiellaceae bacterium]